MDPPSLIHAFYEHLLSAYWVPGTPGSWQEQEDPACPRVTVFGKRGHPWKGTAGPRRCYRRAGSRGSRGREKLRERAPVTRSGTDKSKVWAEGSGLVPRVCKKGAQGQLRGPRSPHGALAACPTQPLFPSGPLSVAHGRGQTGQHRREGGFPGLSSGLGLRTPRLGSHLPHPLQSCPSPGPPPSPGGGGASFTGGSRASRTAKSQCTEDGDFQRLPESTGLPGAASRVPGTALVTGVLKSLQGESLHRGSRSRSHAALRRPWGTLSPWDRPFSGDPRSCVLSTRLPPAKEQT